MGETAVEQQESARIQDAEGQGQEGARPEELPEEADVDEISWAKNESLRNAQEKILGARDSLLAAKDSVKGASAGLESALEGIRKARASLGLDEASDSEAETDGKDDAAGDEGAEEGEGGDAGETEAGQQDGLK